MLQKPLKKRKCNNRACRKEFIPAKPFITWCSPECGAIIAEDRLGRARKRKERREAKELKDAKEKIKTREEWLKEAQQAFNAYIRARDFDQPCISCGRYHDGQNHAGHYRTTAAAPELRFNELNVWKQCAPCNNHKHGNITEYRINLVKRIGISRVEWIEGPHDPKKYTIEELKAIKAEYKRKLKELKVS